MITTNKFKERVKKSTDLRKPSSQAFLKGFSEQKQNLPEEGEDFKHTRETIESMIKSFQEKTSLFEEVTEELIQEIGIKGEAECNQQGH